MKIPIRRIEVLEDLDELKRAYMLRTTAPLDGMWLSGFVPMASHYGFYEDGALTGFCCVNEDGYLLQFFLASAEHRTASETLDAILQPSGPLSTDVRGAFVSTAEPGWLSLCLDRFPVHEVHTLMYQLGDTPPARDDTDERLTLTTMAPEHLEEAVAFAVASIGAPREWLTGYYGNLIDRGELFGSWKSGVLVATGECRGNDVYQKRYADLGVIVAKTERCRGLATRVLKRLVEVCRSTGRHPICSTERTNISAQKAIGRAGFISNHRIVRFATERRTW